MNRVAVNILKWFIVILVAVIPAIPIWIMVWWLVVQSFSGRVVLGLLPSQLTLENWKFLWSPINVGTVTYPNIWPIVLNTLLMALTVALVVVTAATLGGYALARLEFKGRTKLMEFIIALHAFPGVILLVALFIILVKLGFYGKGLWTLIGIALIKAGLEVPMSTWILKGFFDSIPWDLEWAAMVDGARRLTIWRKIIFPLVLPGVAAVSIFAFLSGWSEFLLVFTFINNENYYTMPVLIYYMIGEFKFIDWGLLAALGLFYTIPTMIFFALSQKVLLRIYVGGVKG